MSSSHSIWVKLDRYPPVIVRLLARGSRGRRLLTDAEIHERAGGKLTLADIMHLSYAATWDDVSVGKMRAFCLACGVDFAQPRRMKALNRYINHPKFSHLRRDPRFPQIQVMLGELYRHETQRAA